MLLVRPSKNARLLRREAPVIHIAEVGDGGLKPPHPRTLLAPRKALGIYDNDNQKRE
jgi:hypothetical protein